MSAFLSYYPRTFLYPDDYKNIRFVRRCIFMTTTKKRPRSKSSDGSQARVIY